MIIPVDTEKAFENFSILTINKNLQQVRNKGELTQHDKDCLQKKLKANFILNG